MDNNGPLVPAESGPPPLPIAAAYPKVRLWDRFVGSLIDGIVIMAPYIVALMILAVLRDSGFMAMMLLFPVAGLWALAYSLFRDGRKGGRSFGKAFVGTMVVHLPDNKPCNNSQSFIRNLVSLLIGLVPYIGWIVEPAVVIWHKQGQRLGDMAAKTQVIYAADYRPDTAQD